MHTRNNKVSFFYSSHAKKIKPDDLTIKLEQHLSSIQYHNQHNIFTSQTAVISLFSYIFQYTNMDSQQFLTLLQNLTSANNQLRKSAEITFNAFKATALPDFLYTFLNSLLLDIPHDLKLLICILLVICSSIYLLLLCCCYTSVRISDYYF